MPLRLMEPKDKEQILALERIIFPDDAWDEQLFDRYFFKNHCFVSYDEATQAIHGYIFSYHYQGHASIINLGISPSHQKKGIGTSLMEKGISDIKTAYYSANRCLMKLQVKPTNQAAIQLYQRFGFKITSSTREWHQMEYQFWGSNKTIAAMADYFIEALLQYNTAPQHFFCSNEKQRRRVFISHLCYLLEGYKTSTNATPLIQYLQTNIPPISDIHLRSLLNKLMVDLLERVEEPTLTDHNEVIGQLNRWRQQYPQYVKQLNALYSNIEQMLFEGEQLNDDDGKMLMKRLARELNADLDRWVTQHKGILPDQKTYDAFRTKFIARLHSEDPFMQQHPKVCRAIISIVSSILLHLATLGILLGCQYHRTKSNVVRDYLFFSTTKKEKRIQSIEKIIPNLSPNMHPYH